MAPRKNGSAAGKAAKVPDFLKPNGDEIRKLAKARSQAKKQGSEIAGTIGQRIGKMVEDKHLDRKAFGIACGLNDMSDEKLAITLPHLLAYIDDLGLGERASKQGEIFEEEEEGTPAADAGKVTHIGTAARRVAEAAGERTA